MSRLSKATVTLTVLAVLCPLIAGAVVAAQPQRLTGPADEGCECSQWCDPAISFCATLVCSNGTSKECYGKYRDS
jgi:hypothetical protein